MALSQMRKLRHGEVRWQPPKAGQTPCPATAPPPHCGEERSAGKEAL